MADPVTVTIETWDVLKIALGSGTIAALVGGFFQLIRDHITNNREERKNARTDAIHLITKLDVLAMTCAKSYWQFTEEMDQYRGTRWGDNSYPSCKKPLLEIDQAELSRIDYNIAAQIAWLDNEFRLGKQMILIRMELNALPPEIEESYADLVGHYGFRGMALAETLRKKYKIRGDELILKMKDRVIDDTLEGASSNVRSFLSSMN